MATQPGPAALSTLLDDALRQLPANREPAPASDGFLYNGNRHESVPRALFLDTRLTPLERNAWQIIRLMLNADGVTAFPTYDQLRPYLASTPCAQQASYETVARALTLLRLTRWLSRVRRRRDPKTGRIKGNLYVLHDEPLTPFEAMQLDPEYLGLVSHALEHASKAVQRVGYRTLQDISEDPLLSGRVLPTRLQVLALLVSYLGVLLAFGHDIQLDGRRTLLGAALVFASALSYAVYLFGSGRIAGLVQQLGQAGQPGTAGGLHLVGQGLDAADLDVGRGLDLVLGHDGARVAAHDRHVDPVRPVLARPVDGTARLVPGRQGFDGPAVGARRLPLRARPHLPGAEGHPRAGRHRR